MQVLRRVWWRLRRRSGPPPGLSQADAEALFGQGMTAFSEQRFDDAARIGRQLLSFRFTGGYELLAAVQYERGDCPEAIATLREGLAKKPVWRLANLLGNYLSDNGEYEAALEVYERSAGMFGDQPDITDLNRIIALSRAGREDEARSILARLLAKEVRDVKLRNSIDRVATDLGALP
ncbi:tetratricopeptide repeat protein [Sphingomonas cannabina]|uniref:tetratricopeptide repeat protein n=1 Tax=Sphingomonas cannabina TaxID=2899123 RepID=UPI001F1AFE32|nr:tetratricopeptide repeat protein [Sphingomonas cannabina]UIJ43895.1 tetratricopeptide repeat protein [Sphingomonas cannabina]